MVESASGVPFWPPLCALFGHLYVTLLTMESWRGVLPFLRHSQGAPSTLAHRLLGVIGRYLLDVSLTSGKGL